MDPDVGDQQETLEGDECKMETTTEPDGGGLSSLFKRKCKKKSTKDDESQRSSEKDGTLIACSTSHDHHFSEESPATQLIPAGYLNSREFCYKMIHQRRGKLIIISNHYFLEESPMFKYPRHGTEHDVENLQSTFEQLGFDCEVHKDKTHIEMLNIFINASKSEDYNIDCLAFALLSHGEDKGNIHGTDRVISIDSLLSPLVNDTNMKHFAGKPKLLFVQACRGTQLDHGVNVTDDKGDTVQIQRIPVQADFLHMYSSAPGFYSFRGECGSVFIRALCEILRTYHSTLDLLHILTRVNYEVAYFFESRLSRKNPDYDILSYKKQMPTIVSMLTKYLYFVPKHSAVPQ